MYIYGSDCFHFSLSFADLVRWNEYWAGRGYGEEKIRNKNMIRRLSVLSLVLLVSLVLAGAGCFGGGVEPEIEVQDEVTTETEQDEPAAHPLAPAIGPWHVVLLPEAGANVPAGFKIEGDIIFHADGTSAGKFETSDFNTGTYTFTNGQVHAIADNGSIEFTATITGDSASGTWHNLVSDIRGPMTAT